MDEIRQSRSRGGRNGEKRNPPAAGGFLDRGQARSVRGVDLARDEDLRACGDLGREGRELLLDGRDVGFGVALLRRIDEMAEGAAPLDVLEEPDAEAGSFVRAPDQPGNVRDDERVVAAPDDAEVRERAS